MLDFRTAAVTLTAVTILLWTSGATAAGVVFRYLPGAPAISSPVESRNAEEGPYLDPRELLARGPGGWGYDPAWAVEFESPESMLWGDANEDVNQPLGPNITAEVWVRLLDVGEENLLLTNRVGASDGFTLGLEAGRPYFEIALDGDLYRVNGSDAVAADEDVWFAATAVYSGPSGLELTLYRNGSMESRVSFAATIPTPYVIRHPFYVGTKAEGTDESPQLSGTLTGLLYAALVRDYVAAEAYLNTPPPFDGSTYFGLPDFHDYEIGSFQLPMDQRIDTYPTPLKQKVYVPYVNDEFIPQGTAVKSADDSREAELIYLSYYHRTRDNRLRTQRSIIVEIEAVNGAVRRTFRLSGRLEDSHAGGIALSGGALYVSSSSYLERYPLPEFDPELPRYLDLVADEEGSATVRSKASFVSAFNDTLWVGDYRTDSEQAPYLYGYPLDASGGLIPGAEPVVFLIPRRIQGVDFFTDDGTTYVFMSRNRNSTEAEALRFRRADLNPYSVPSWEASITLPHGIEDLSFAADGTLWSNSESGTDFYQRNAEWSSFFPFAFGVERAGIIPVSAERLRPATAYVDVDVYPNPTRGRVTIEFTTDRAAHTCVRVVDSLGRSVALLEDQTLGPGPHSIRWDTSRLATGVYLIVVEDGARQRYQTFTVVR